MNQEEPNKVKILYEAVNKILAFTKGMKSAEDLTSHQMAWDAVKMNLVVIYEMNLKISPDFKKKYNHVEWELINEYKPILESPLLGFDSDEIWKAIHDKMPEFKKQIENIS